MSRRSTEGAAGAVPGAAPAPSHEPARHGEATGAVPGAAPAPSHEPARHGEATGAVPGAAQWQICFDDGHQQRYLPDRQAVLRYVLAIGAKAASKRFEVFTEAAPVLLSD